MVTDIGEYIVGAYLQMKRGCDVVNYNVRPPGGGMAGLGEMDVMGFNFKDERAILSEVTTHIQGLLYTDAKTTVEKIVKKYDRQKEYSQKNLSMFKQHEFMFWSPIVPKGLAGSLASDPRLEGLKLVINSSYTSAINELKVKAKEIAHDTGNPFFRSLQILEHLRQ